METESVRLFEGCKNSLGSIDFPFSTSKFSEMHILLRDKKKKTRNKL